MNALIRIDLDRVIGHVDRRIFGGFVEHLGRCIYGGIFDEGSPLSDESGFRRDVLSALKALLLFVNTFETVHGDWPDVAHVIGLFTVKLPDSNPVVTAGTGGLVDRRSGTKGWLISNVSTRLIGSVTVELLTAYSAPRRISSW